MKKPLARKFLESIPNFDFYKRALKNDKNTSLKQMLRDSIIGELDAISLYEVQIAAIEDEMAKKVLSSIRDEEIAHVGELYSLIKKVDSGIEGKVGSGEDEVKEMIEKSGLNIPLGI